jgi:bifunctional DNase/RNase
MMSSQHVVILRDTVRERYLPIWIGPGRQRHRDAPAGRHARAPHDP